MKARALDAVKATTNIQKFINTYNLSMTDDFNKKINELCKKPTQGMLQELEAILGVLNKNEANFEEIKNTVKVLASFDDEKDANAECGKEISNLFFPKNENKDTRISNIESIKEEYRNKTFQRILKTPEWVAVQKEFSHIASQSTKHYRELFSTTMNALRQNPTVRANLLKSAQQCVADSQKKINQLAKIQQTWEQNTLRVWNTLKYNYASKKDEENFNEYARLFADNPEDETNIAQAEALVRKTAERAEAVRTLVARWENVKDEAATTSNEQKDYESYLRNDRDKDVSTVVFDLKTLVEYIELRLEGPQKNLVQEKEKLEEITQKLETLDNEIDELVESANQLLTDPKGEAGNLTTAKFLLNTDKSTIQTTIRDSQTIIESPNSKTVKNLEADIKIVTAEIVKAENVLAKKQDSVNQQKDKIQQAKINIAATAPVSTPVPTVVETLVVKTLVVEPKVEPQPEPKPVRRIGGLMHIFAGTVALFQDRNKAYSGFLGLSFLARATTVIKREKVKQVEAQAQHLQTLMSDKSTDDKVILQAAIAYERNLNIFEDITKTSSYGLFGKGTSGNEQAFIRENRNIIDQVKHTYSNPIG